MTNWLFAQVLYSLQQLQTVAHSATASENTGLATELNQLAADFSRASTGAQLRNVQDLAQAIGVGRHHHHFHDGGSASSTNNSAAGSTGTTGNGLHQLIRPLSPSQTGMVANNSLNPLSIIDTRLLSARIQTG
jgi:hypothetical protein